MSDAKQRLIELNAEKDATISQLTKKSKACADNALRNVGKARDERDKALVEVERLKGTNDFAYAATCSKRALLAGIERDEALEKVGNLNNALKSFMSKVDNLERRRKSEEKRADTNLDAALSLQKEVDRMGSERDDVLAELKEITRERDAALTEVERLKSTGGLGKAWSLAGVEYLRGERDAALIEVKRLKQSEDEYASINQRMDDLLTQTAAALKGDPPPLTSHDWSDLPKVAERLRGAVAAVEELLVEWERYLMFHITDPLRTALARAAE